MNDRSGNGTRGLKVKTWTNTAMFTSMRMARSGESRYLVRESKVLIKDKAKIVSRVTGNR